MRMDSFVVCCFVSLTRVCLLPLLRSCGWLRSWSPTVCTHSDKQSAADDDDDDDVQTISLQSDHRVYRHCPPLCASISCAPPRLASPVFASHRDRLSSDFSLTQLCSWLYLLPCLLPINPFHSCPLLIPCCVVVLSCCSSLRGCQNSRHPRHSRCCPTWWRWQRRSFFFVRCFFFSS